MQRRNVCTDAIIRRRWDVVGKEVRKCAQRRKPNRHRTRTKCFTALFPRSWRLDDKHGREISETLHKFARERKWYTYICTLPLSLFFSFSLFLSLFYAHSCQIFFFACYRVSERKSGSDIERTLWNAVRRLILRGINYLHGVRYQIWEFGATVVYFDHAVASRDILIGGLVAIKVYSEKNIKKYFPIFDKATRKIFFKRKTIKIQNGKTEHANADVIGTNIRKYFSVSR